MKQISSITFLYILFIPSLYAQKNLELRKKAENFIDSLDFKSAKPLYDTLILMNPLDDTSYYNRGICKLSLEDY